MAEQPTDTADIFLQWKGTDACFDFHCPCGNSDHIDADFAYYVTCDGCGQTYEMPSNLTARRVTGYPHMSTVHARKDGWEYHYSSQQSGSDRDALFEALSEMVSLYHRTACPPPEVRQSTVEDVFKTHGLSHMLVSGDIANE